MSRPSKTGVKGLYLSAGQYRIDLRWTDLVSGMPHRHRERLPAGTSHAMAIDRARRVLGLSLEGVLKQGALDGWFDAVDPPESGGVYAVMGRGNFVKIGRAGNIAERVRSLQTAHSVPLRLLAVLSNNPADEAAFHKRFAAVRTHGEWFAINADLVAEIRRARTARKAAA